MHKIPGVSVKIFNGSLLHNQSHCYIYILPHKNPTETRQAITQETEYYTLQAFPYFSRIVSGVTIVSPHKTKNPLPVLESGKYFGTHDKLSYGRL